MEKVNIAEKLSKFSDYWNPRVVGDLNNQQVRLVKLKGPFVWHKQDDEDEVFFVFMGVLNMEFRHKTVTVNEQEFTIVPRGVEHRPVANEEVSLMLFEPATTLNTGNVQNELTREDLEKI